MSEQSSPAIQALADEVFTLVGQGEDGLVLAPDATVRLRDMLLAISLDQIEDAVEEVLAVAHFLDAHKESPQVARGLLQALEAFMDYVVKAGVPTGVAADGVERSRRQLKTMLGRPTALKPTLGGLAPPSGGTGLGPKGDGKKR